MGAACEDAHITAANGGHLPGAAALGTLAGKCSSEPPAFWLRWALKGLAELPEGGGHTGEERRSRSSVWKT